ncbi:phage baseplate assembly protein V [Lentzea sp. E54]|uniref:phage baseplate assembly protein V n=1 Tax=Lentzea xerophila TaxID=3435883 RepID=UPI003DA42A89
MPENAGSKVPVTANVRAQVQLGRGRAALTDRLQDMLLKVLVDNNLHRPDMVELTFLDQTGDILSELGVTIGSPIRVLDGERGATLIDGEVTALEAVCAHTMAYTVIRGYEKSHRLQRARRTRTFVNLTDSDIVRQIASSAGVPVGRIDESGITHDHIGQIAQTDWEFLRERADEIGFDLGVAEGELYFREAEENPPGADAPPELIFRNDLLSFLPRITGANLAAEVEVRVWDPQQGKVVVETAPVATTTARLGEFTPADVAASLRPAGSGTPATEPQASSDLGPVARPDAYAVVGRPLGTGASISRAAEGTAKAFAKHYASTFAEAEGRSFGNAALLPGAPVTISGVPDQFAGTWRITSTRHVFCDDDGGYFTEFEVTGGHERSLLGLVDGRRAVPASRIDGVVCGIVTNTADPAALRRVKVALPWLSADYETGWARTVQFGAGARSGAIFLPEVGDEVLLAFEQGDPRRPYVVGGLVNQRSKFELGTEVLKKNGQTSSVVARGFATPAGNRLVFQDDVLPPPDTSPPTTSKITLGTTGDDIALVIDQIAGTLTLSCAPRPPGSKSEQGTINITCGDGGKVNIAAGRGGAVHIAGGEGGSVEIDAGSSFGVKAQGAVTIQSDGPVKIKGATIELN